MCSSQMCGEVLSSSCLGTVIAVLALCHPEMRSSVTTLLEFQLLLKLVSSEVGFRMEEKKD